ncbi:hypothetical protein OROGR_002443 [Orobanche gracilis]
MEAVARRRIAVLSSHVHPPAETRTLPTCILASACASDANGENEMRKGQTDCVFCKIIRGEAPALKVIRRRSVLVHFGFISSVSWVRHSLIVPKCHFPSLDATPPSIISAMCSKVPLISNAVMKATGCGNSVSDLMLKPFHA